MTAWMSAGDSNVSIKGLAPIKPDGHGPRETACHLAQPRHLVVPNGGNDHLTSREVLGTLNVALVDCETAVSTQPLEDLVI